MQQTIKTEISSEDQKLIDYSFELLLINVLFKRKEITEEEYKKLKIILEDEYLNSSKKNTKVMV